MYLLFVIGVWIILGWVLIDWKNWKQYYPTVLYYITMNLLYEYIYFNNTLFAFKGITSNLLNHSIILMAFLFIIMPAVIIIFLQRLPRGIMVGIIYTSIWIVFFIVVEYLFLQKGMYIYDNGWSIWHSLLFDIMMFSLLILHNKKPVFTFGLTFICIAIFIILFPITITSLK